MSELGEIYKEQKIKRRAIYEEPRTTYARNELEKRGHTVSGFCEMGKFFIVNNCIKFYPYTGWYTGKGVGSGRGIENLIKKLV